MPSKNTLKTYVEDGFYHIYNRGIGADLIFRDLQDSSVFLSYLKTALLPPPDRNSLTKNLSFKGQTFKGIPRQPQNFQGHLELIAYCLMPNHFHFLVHQQEKNTIADFMRSLLTRYSMYFNNRHDRQGSLFQGRYKAILVDNDTYLLHLSRYIHLNPQGQTDQLTNWHSSYADYLGQRQSDWLNPGPVLDFFASPDNTNYRANSYQNFVEHTDYDSQKILGDLTLVP